MSSPPYFQIQHLPEQAMVRTQWLRMVDSGEYRQSLRAICQMLINSKATYWLIDSRNATSPNISDQHWTSEILSEHLAKSPLRKIAIILPNDLFLEVVAERMSAEIRKALKNQIQIAHFANEQLALYWLASSIEQEGLFRNAAVK